MALNLWKVGGQPTSYNPLPLGNSAKVTLNFTGTTIMRVKAKSASGASLEISDQVSKSKTFTLTNESKVNEFEISSRFPLIREYPTTKGDIIIESIELVEKPLPKLTINGIDGFNSGKWALHPTSKVIDDETLEINPSVTYSNNNFTFYGIVVGATYSVNFWTDSTNIDDGRCKVYCYDSSNTALYTSPNYLTGFSFTIPNNTTKIVIRFENGVTVGKKIIFKRPMLNLGSIPAPYEPKRGERMVIPTPKKNLFDGQLELGTINGVDGKANSPDAVRSVNKIPVKPNTTLTLSNDKGYQNVNVYFYDGVGGYIGTQSNGMFTTPSNAYFIMFRTSVALKQNDLTTKFQLEEGMSATPYEPYVVQMNPKPKKYVPKKNVIPTDVNEWENGTYDWNNGSAITVANRIRTKNFFTLTGSKTYVFSLKGSYQFNVLFYDVNKNRIGLIDSSFWQNPRSFTTPSNAVFGKLMIASPDSLTINDFANIQPQLEEGSTSTPFEPYQQVLPRSRTGLAFNGTSDYLQLPSMTMDAIEIDCLIDSSNTSSQIIFDAWSGAVNTFARADGTGGSAVTITGFKKGERAKVKISTISPFTDDVTIFANSAGVSKTKGTLYKVTCYLNGAIVAQYDFENPNNIVGDKVLPNAKNLIPSFEDSRWNLDTNAKVFGKDVLNMFATSSGRVNNVMVNVLPNTTYLFKIQMGSDVEHRYRVRRDSFVGSILANLVASGQQIITTPSDISSLYIQLQNNGIGSGSFDFIRPQMYELTGKEGTIVGKPTPLLKAPKRNLYNKR